MLIVLNSLFSPLLCWHETREAARVQSDCWNGMLINMTLTFPRTNDSHRNALNYRIDSQTPENTSHFAMRITLFSSLRVSTSVLSCFNVAVAHWHSTNEIWQPYSVCQRGTTCVLQRSCHLTQCHGAHYQAVTAWGEEWDAKLTGAHLTVYTMDTILLVSCTPSARTQ